MKHARQKKKTRNGEKSRKRKGGKRKKKPKSVEKRKKDAIVHHDRDQDRVNGIVKEIIGDGPDDQEVEIKEEDPEAEIDHVVGIGGGDQDLGSGLFFKAEFLF